MNDSLFEHAVHTMAVASCNFGGLVQLQDGSSLVPFAYAPQRIDAVCVVPPLGSATYPPTSWYARA